MFGNNDYRDYLMHKAADGSEWKSHKYIDKVRTSNGGWRYIYPEHMDPYKRANYAGSRRAGGIGNSMNVMSRRVNNARVNFGKRHLVAEPISTVNERTSSSRRLEKGLHKAAMAVKRSKVSFGKRQSSSSPARLTINSAALNAKMVNPANKTRRSRALVEKPISKSVQSAKRRIENSKLNFMNYAHPQNNKTPIAKARQKASRFKRRNFETFARNARHIRQAT